MGYGTREFMSRTKTSGFGKMADWKDDGKTIGWIHPDGFKERRMHNMMARAFKDKTGSTVVGMKLFVCPGNACPLCTLVDWARTESENSDEDFIVLNRTIKAKDQRDQDRRIRYTIRELAGQGDWKRKMASNREFLFGWVRRDKRNHENPVEVMQAGVGLSTAIQRVIRSQMEDYGEVKGDPLQRPYAIKLTYDKDAQPAQKFGAERVSEDLAPLDDEVKKILKTPMAECGVDLDRMSKADTRQEILAAIELCWDEDCPVAFEDFSRFCGDVEEDVEEEGDLTEKEKRMDKARDRRDGMHGRSRDVEPERDSGDREDGGEVGCDEDAPPPSSKRKDGRAESRSRREPASEPVEEEKPRSGRRATAPDKEEPKGKGKLITCPECGNKVAPNKYGKCPECMAELDVPY